MYLRNYAKEAVWQCLYAGVLGSRRGKTKPEWMATAVCAMRGELTTYQDVCERSKRDKKITRIQQIEPSTLGTARKRKLNTNAGETIDVSIVVGQFGEVREDIHRRFWCLLADCEK